MTTARQPNTLGRCSECGRGWLQFHADTGGFRCHRCGYEIQRKEKPTMAKADLSVVGDGATANGEDRGQQTNLDITKASRPARALARKLFAVKRALRELGGAKTALEKALRNQMERDKKDAVDVDGVPLSIDRRPKLKMESFSQWQPEEDPLPAVLSALGIDPSDLVEDDD